MVQANDLSIYERHAGEWWDPRSAAFRSLHSVNEFRTELLCEWLGGAGARALAGQVVVDLGCGGGLLAAPLLAAGARVVGVDRSLGSLRAATARLGTDSPLRAPATPAGCFVHGDLLQAPLADRSADLVLLADVLEHVDSVAAALGEAARLLRAGGLLYVNTINRTWRARLLAVEVAERLALVPRGTHDARKFVAPAELRLAAARHGLRLLRTQGESVDLLRTARRWAIALRRSEDLSIGYSALLVKESTEVQA